MSFVQAVKYIFFLLDNKAEELKSDRVYKLLASTSLNYKFFLDLRNLLYLYDNSIHTAQNVLINDTFVNSFYESVRYIITNLINNEYLNTQSANKIRNKAIGDALGIPTLPVIYDYYFHQLKDHSLTYETTLNNVIPLPNNSIIATSFDGKLILFDLMLNDEQFEIGHIGDILIMCNTKVLLECGNRLIVWNYETKSTERVITTEYHNIDIKLISPGKFVTISTDGILRIWEDYKDTQLCTIYFDKIICLDYIVGWMINYKKWTVYKLDATSKDMFIEFAIINILKLSNTKYVVITVNDIYVYDTYELQFQIKNEYPNYTVKLVASLPNDKLFVMLSDSRGVRSQIFQVWNLTAQTLQFIVGHNTFEDSNEDYFAECITVLPNNEVLLGGYSEFYIYNMESNTLKSLPHNDAQYLSDTINQMYVLPDLRILTISYVHNILQIYG